MIKLKDIFKLINLKKEKCNNLDDIKEEMLKENYNLLAKCLGELPFIFDYEYKNKNGEKEYGFGQKINSCYQLDIGRFVAEHVGKHFSEESGNCQSNRSDNLGFC